MAGVRELIDIKSREVFTIDQDRSVADAVGQMAEQEVGSLIVLAAGKPVGMFTERDVLKVWAKLTRVHDTRFRDIPLRDVMTRDLIVVSPNDSLEYVVSVMTRNRVRHLPVIENGRVVAVLSMRDVVRSLVTNLQVELHYLREYIGGGYQ